MDEKGQRPQHSVNLSQAEDSVADGQSISSLAMSIEEILSQNSLLGKTHCNNHLDGVVVSDVSINLHLVGIQTYPLEEPKRGFVLMAVGSHGSHDGLVHVSSTCLGDLSWVEVFTPPFPGRQQIWPSQHLKCLRIGKQRTKVIARKMPECCILSGEAQTVRRFMNEWPFPNHGASQANSISISHLVTSTPNSNPPLTRDGMDMVNIDNTFTGQMEALCQPQRT